jgi:hypothetical protein
MWSQPLSAVVAARELAHHVPQIRRLIVSSEPTVAGSALLGGSAPDRP